MRIGGRKATDWLLVVVSLGVARSAAGTVEEGCCCRHCGLGESDGELERVAVTFR
jgi:hypothetical protein